MPRDIHNQVNEDAACVPQTISATQSALPIIDTQFYDALEFLIAIGTPVTASAGNTVTVSLVHGDDSGLSDSAAVAAADLIGTPLVVNGTTGLANSTSRLGYIGSKRYVRLVLTVVGTVSVPFAALAVKGMPKRKPTAA